MKILMTGATGLVGGALIPVLEGRGDRVVRLRRSGGAPGEPVWDPAWGLIDAGALEGFDGIIHLAGESIAGLRWTAAKKRRIRDSRVGGTQLLAKTLAGLSRPPRWMICASAVGFYGDRGDDVLREDNVAGKGFLGEVCQAWEDAAEPARSRGVRVSHLRLGIVLSRTGGVLPLMLIPFRLGLGGRIGSGKQYMPWISIDDVAGAVRHIMDKEISGPVNMTAPEAVTNAGFSATLGCALHRPAVIPLPAFAARLALGEMAEELLLSSQRVEPVVLSQTGYRFKHPTLEASLRDILKKGGRSS
jgi:uncharacterized protein (TIGR01777 family)